MEKLLTGTFAKVKFAHSVKDVLDEVVNNGIAHHVIMGYIRYKEVVKILAKLMNWDVIEC